MQKGKRKRRRISIALTAVMAVSMLMGVPMDMETVKAAGTGTFTVFGGTEGTDYSYSGGVLTIKTGKSLTIQNADGATPTTDSIAIDSALSTAANITLAGVDIELSELDESTGNYINVGEYTKAAFFIPDDFKQDVNLKLTGVNKLYSSVEYAAIEKSVAVADSGTLTISGEGSLDIGRGSYAAGIGGHKGKSTENIVIESGTITACGYGGGAGIGGGANGGAGKNIQITGGNVTVTAYVGGAGIGGGANSGAGKNIQITGGDVTACAYGGGAGIGGGKNGAGEDISITGGKVNAAGLTTQMGSAAGAGIGGGTGSNKTSETNGINITIGGAAVVNASSQKYSAGIGGGQYGAGKNIIISGGKVTASGGTDAAGIGGGYGGSLGTNNLRDKYSDIQITGGTITAKGGSSSYDRYGAGIGEACNYDYAEVEISGGNIYAASVITVGNAPGAIVKEDSIGGGSLTSGEDKSEVVYSMDAEPQVPVSLVALSGYPDNQPAVPTLIKAGEIYTNYNTDGMYPIGGKLYLYLEDGVSAMSADECLDEFTIQVTKGGSAWNDCGEVTLVESLNSEIIYTAYNRSGGSFTFKGTDGNGIFKKGTYNICIGSNATGKTVTIGQGNVADITLNYYPVTVAAVSNGNIEYTAETVEGKDYTFKVTANTGYTVESVSYSVNSGMPIPLTGSGGTYTIPASAVTGSIYITAVTQKIIIDTTPPTASITIDGRVFDTINTNPAFKRYKISSLNAAISGSDENGVKETAYAVSDTIYTSKESIQGAALTWETGNSCTITSDTNQIVYARVTDKADNVTYVSTVGIYADTAAPSVSSVSLSEAKEASLKYSFTLGEEACSYAYVVLPASAAAPSDYQAVLNAIADGNGGSSLTNGSQVVTGTTSGLNPNTSYLLYAAAKDNLTTLQGSSTGNEAVVTSSAVSTIKATPTIEVKPELTGPYGTKVSDMIFYNGKVTWNGSELSGTWSAKSGGSEIPSVGTQKEYSVQFTPEGSEYNSVQTSVKPIVSQREISNITVEAIGDKRYTGEQIKPDVVVNDTRALITSSDYIISYGTNKSVGTASGEVIITGQGNYKGTCTKKFNIIKAVAQPSDQTISVKAGSTVDRYEYDLSKLLPSSVKDMMGTVTYEIRAESGSIIADAISETVNSSTYNIPVNTNLAAGLSSETVTVTIKSTNYEDMVAGITVNITEKTSLSLTGISAADVTYNGNPQEGYTGEMVWKNGNDKVNISDTVITYTGSDTKGNAYNAAVAPTKAGSYRVTFAVPADNNDYTGSASYSYCIQKANYNMTNVKWNYTVPFTYDGQQHKVEVTGCPAGVTPLYTDNGKSEEGTYTATVSFSVTDDTNYNVPAALPNCMWQIIAAVPGDETLLLSGVYPDNEVYSGGAKKGYSGTIEWKNSSSQIILNENQTKITYTGTDASGRAYSSSSAPVNAGSYTVSFQVKDSVEGYNGSGSVSFVIGKADYSMAGAAWNYSGTPFIQNGTEYSVAVTGYPAGVTPSYTGNRAVNAGSYVAKVTFTVADSTNYNIPVMPDCRWRIIEASGGDTGNTSGGNTGDIPGGGVQPLPAGTTQTIGGQSYEVTVSSATAGEVTLTAVANKKIKSVTIPATVAIGNVTYKVTGIANNAFKGCSAITKVTIPNNIKTIGKNAFAGCKKLTTVKMGSGLKEIAAGAFSSCTKLKTVTIGSNVKKIGDKAFYKCVSLTKITIPSNVKEIGKQAFYGNKRLKTMTIKSKILKKVGSKAITGIQKKAVIKCPSKKLAAKYKKLFKSSTGYKKSMKIK